jgi:hypothetical protein
MKSRLTAALIGVALTLAGLLVLEGVSRALLTAQADLTPEQPDWYRYTPDLGWERRPHFKGLVAGEVHRHEPARYLREFDAQGFFAVDTAQIGPTTRKRILAIGDSNTFGWGVPTRNAYPEVLDELRADADVINLGVSGYTSLQGYASLIKHFDRVRPDVVIASFSFNDRRVVPSDSAADSHEKFAREARLHRFDFRAKTLSVPGTGTPAGRKCTCSEAAATGSTTVDARTAPTRVSPEHYRAESRTYRAILSRIDTCR